MKFKLSRTDIAALSSSTIQSARKKIGEKKFYEGIVHLDAKGQLIIALNVNHLDEKKLKNSSEGVGICWCWGNYTTFTSFYDTRPSIRLRATLYGEAGLTFAHTYPNCIIEYKENKSPFL